MFSRRSEDGKHPYRTAIVDIGSNSVRLVVYSGSRRNPAIIFNEKVMAGLGSELSDTGNLGEASMERALLALRRFRQLARDMQVNQTICVATAAVREAGNGPEFVERVRSLGIDLRLLEGDDEARIAAYGVLSAIPDAHGLVGDLGGGSLEIALVRGGEVLDRASFPMGVLRAKAFGTHAALRKAFEKLLKEHPWTASHTGLPLYLVGGSWRALARLDMQLTHYPLPVLHHYQIALDRFGPLGEALDAMEREELRAMPMLPGSRVDYLGDALELLEIVAAHAGSSEALVSAYGLREGLLYDAMTPEVRKRDPLLAAAMQFGRSQSRFDEDGDAIYDWISPVFADDPPEWQRLLRAACHLADSAWQANPDFRAERGLETALHGNWVGLDAAGRMLIAQALFTNFGGGTDLFDSGQGLVEETAMVRAAAWGCAIRLAQRLGGGTSPALRRSSLRMVKGRLELRVLSGEPAMLGEVTARRLKKLAQMLEVEHELLAA